MTVERSAASLPAEARKVLEFWFLDLMPADWFQQSDSLDARIADRFGSTLDQASTGALDHWAQTARGRLALIIVLDQFSRNIHRGTGQAFAHDRRAQSLALAAIEHGEDETLGLDERQFLYMPLMHAEDRDIQAMSVELFEALVASARNILAFAHQHRDIVDSFGRFPYRNLVLGRDSTPAERAFVQSEGNPFS